MEINNEIILIVDDNAKNLQLTGSILKEEGYRISLAIDAAAALDQLKDITPDLILLDIMMPVTDGLELCTIIKSEPKLAEIPVIFLTAKDQTEDLIAGFRAGGVDYIVKPFIREELLIRVKTHIDLYKSHKRLAEANRIRDNLYSVIAHDIRSPFSNIQMIISSIAAGYFKPCSEDFSEIITHLDKTVNETRDLLDNLLDYARNRTYDNPEPGTSNDLAAVISSCIDYYKTFAESKKIEIKLNVKEGTRANFEVTSMSTVFRNLIYNGLKFTPENGSIEIRTCEEADYISVSFEDKGIGMSSEIYEKIFIRNESHSSPGTNNERGSGLGLFIVRDLLKLNNCKFDLESVRGKGTTAKVLIPA